MNHVDDRLGFSNIILYILPANVCKYFVQVGLSTTVQLLDHLPRAEKKGWWTMIHIDILKLELEQHTIPYTIIGPTWV